MSQKEKPSGITSNGDSEAESTTEIEQDEILTHAYRCTQDQIGLLTSPMEGILRNPISVSTGEAGKKLLKKLEALAIP